MPPLVQNPGAQNGQAPQPQIQAPQWDNLSKVVYYADAMQMGQIPAALIAIGNYVQLYKVDQTTNQLSEKIFSATWTEITSIVTNMNMITFKSQGKSFTVDFNTSLTKAAAEMGVATQPGNFGLIASTAAQAAETRDMNQALDNIQGESGNNFRWWLQEFKAHGIVEKESFNDKFLKHPFRYIGIVLGACIALFILYLVIGSLLSGY